jgi:hypothetical protein
VARSASGRPSFSREYPTRCRHARQGHDADAYLLGETSPTGFGYFFFVALALKTPLALVGLMILGLLVCQPLHQYRGYPAFSCRRYRVD